MSGPSWQPSLESPVLLAVDFDGHGVSFGLTNRRTADFPLLLCAWGKTDFLHPPRGGTSQPLSERGDLLASWI